MNYGPGHAIKISILVEMNGCNGVEKAKAVGPNFLPSNCCADYEISEDYGFQVITYICINYESQTGKKYSDKWIYSVQGKGPKIRLAK